MKFSLCIEPVFENLPFYERFRMAKDCGCDAVEFWDPWVGSEAVTPAGLGKASSDAGIPVAACCLNQAWTVEDCKGECRKIHRYRQGIRLQDLYRPVWRSGGEL